MDQLSRRDFLLTGAGLGLAAAARGQEGLPTRVLGRTGRQVSILGLGTAPIGEARGDIEQAAAIFAETLDRGVNYVDTARIYGIAEAALAKILPTRRERLFLVTKVWTDNAAGAAQSLEESLRTLGVDHVDLVHLHNAGDKNPERVLADDGVLAYLAAQKQAGKLRHIGLTGHCNPGRFARLIETDQVDVVMNVINYADHFQYAFDEKVLPLCRERNIGVAAMKVYAGIKGGFPNHRNGSVGCATPPGRLAAALAWALDLPGVATAVVGPFTMAQTVANVELARAYRPLSEAARDELLAYGRQLAPQLGPRYGGTV